MDCPRCGEQLVGGEVEIRGTLLSFMVFGLSRQSLWWYPADDPFAKVRLLRPIHTVPALRCDACATVVFTAEE